MRKLEQMEPGSKQFMRKYGSPQSTIIPNRRQNNFVIEEVYEGNTTSDQNINRKFLNTQNFDQMADEMFEI